jgi:NADH:ubiquinone oxidoreductase subunit 5 (subunit L)/multisubunit Na+/H+ antiporter MnhA subunit/NADH:ubiquinone oxidoreductase subunit 6 (subunit J)
MIIISLVLPLLLSIIIGFFGRALGKDGVRYLIVIGFIITIIINIISLFAVMQDEIILIEFGPIIEFHQLVTHWTFVFDSLSVTMLLMVACVSFIVHLFSFSYMNEDPHLIRFLAYLMLFTFFMFFYVVAGNLLQLFMGWEGIGVCSYLLINFWFTRTLANKAALKAMFINKIGDISLLASFILLYLVMHTNDLLTMFAYAEVYSMAYYYDILTFKVFLNNPVKQLQPLFMPLYIENQTYWGGTSYRTLFFNVIEGEESGRYFPDIGYKDFLRQSGVLGHISYFIPAQPILHYILGTAFLGVMTKSAQFGFHTWLPDAMEGPTPVSALIHAATMVTAGIYMFLRLSPIFQYYTMGFNVIVIVGAITAFYSALTAVAQVDVKKIIAYSTCSQLGYMVVALGYSQFSVSFFHLVNHAFFKALLFLTAGSIIHILLDEQDMRRAGNLEKFAPFTSVLCSIGSMAIIGFPFLAGFYSKDLIIELSILSTSNEYFSLIPVSWIFILLIMAAIFTTIYSCRLVYFIFLTSTTQLRIKAAFLHESDVLLLWPLILLVIGSLLSGYFGFELFCGNNSQFFSVSLPAHFHKLSLFNAEYIPLFIKLIPTICCLSTAYLTFYFYTINFIVLRSLKYQYYLVFSAAMSNFNSNFLQTIHTKVGIIYAERFVLKIFDKGMLEICGPIFFTKTLKEITTWFIIYHNRSVYDYVWFSAVSGLLLSSLSYLAVCFFTPDYEIIINLAEENYEFIYEELLALTNNDINGIITAALNESGFEGVYEDCSHLTARPAFYMFKDNYIYAMYDLEGRAVEVNSVTSCAILFVIISIVLIYYCFLRELETNNPIITLIFFLLTIVSNVGLLFLYNCEYLALIFLIIYAGAIVILFLFILIMCNLDFRQQNYIDRRDINKEAAAVFIVGVVFILFYILVHYQKIVIWYDTIQQSVISNDYVAENIFVMTNNYDIAIFGEYLLNYYAITLSVCGFMLFIAMLGSILITMIEDKSV